MLFRSANVMLQVANVCCNDDVLVAFRDVMDKEKIPKKKLQALLATAFTPTMVAWQSLATWLNAGGQRRRFATGCEETALGTCEVGRAGRRGGGPGGERTGRGGGGERDKVSSEKKT